MGEMVVAPYAGAWIEMLVSVIMELANLGRPLCGGVD